MKPFGMSFQKRIPNMPGLKIRAASARVVAVIALAGVGLGACVSQDAIDQQFATVNSRLDQVDARVQAAAQQASAANQAAQQANQSAQQANQSAQQANQRIDELNTRVNQMQQGPARTPRG
jgi:murein lipoprotein